MSDISSLLAIHKPRIVVDEDGGKLLYNLAGHASFFSVGGIICGRDVLSPQDDMVGSPLNESCDESGMPFFVAGPFHLKSRALTIFTDRQSFMTTPMFIILIYCSRFI